MLFFPGKTCCSHLSLARLLTFRQNIFQGFFKFFGDFYKFSRLFLEHHTTDQTDRQTARRTITNLDAVSDARLDEDCESVDAVDSLLELVYLVIVLRLLQAFSTKRTQQQSQEQIQHLKCSDTFIKVFTRTVPIKVTVEVLRCFSLSKVQKPTWWSSMQYQTTFVMHEFAFSNQSWGSFTLRSRESDIAPR